MITIRHFTPNDIAELERLHSLHFKDEFDLLDFMSFICAFVVEDEKGIITIGGVRDIAECIAVTDLSRFAKVRAQALYKLMDASTFVCKKSNYDQMYIWSQNPKYTNRLMQNGFRSPQGQSLILDL